MALLWHKMNVQLLTLPASISSAEEDCYYFIGKSIFTTEEKNIEKLFKLREHGTDVRTEVTAGITTFLAMVYILAVNPSILSAAGMNNAAVFTATAISAAFATLIMAFYANYPVALASGMGLIREIERIKA